MAKNQDIQFLPKFSSLQRVNSEIILTVTATGTRLRDYLLDRKTIKQKGDLLFSVLLDGVMDLYDRGWVLRSMWPNDIVVQEEEGFVVFTNIVYMCEENKEDNYFTAVPSPYSPAGMPELNLLKSSDIDTNHWAAGIILLEILIGSKLVLGLESYNDIKWLLASIHNYIDTDTHLMLTWLLERSIDFDMKKYIDVTLAAQPELIMENIVRLELAIHCDQHLFSLH
jgi:hypothetical protein